jgi:hypothetical protein
VDAAGLRQNNMRTFIATCALLLAVLPAVPQEGHPLSGTWTGDAGATVTARQHLTIVLNWDGKNITGLLNPGPDAGTLSSVTLDPATWTVRLEGQLKDASGKPVAFSGEGKIENLGSIHRTIKGTWKQGAISGDFRLTRD